MLDLTIQENIYKVQQGHREIREELIKKYLPFILKVSSQTCRRYVRLGEDDEVSVALIAFNEALDKFDCSKQSSFLAFAETIIKRRLIDYFRSKRGNEAIPWSALGDEEDDKEGTHRLDKLTWQESFNQHHEKDLAMLRRDEILEYQEKLAEYNISLKDLVEVSPRHQDARSSAYQVASVVAERQELYRHLVKTKSLPLKELEKEVKVSRKTLERQRKYIIALVIILTGEFYLINDYLQGLKG